MSSLAAWLAAIAGGPDLSRGLCVGQADLFDDTDDPLAVEQAIELCGTCPVLQRCTEWSEDLDPRDLSGVVAGVVRPWRPSRSAAS